MKSNVRHFVPAVVLGALQVLLVSLPTWLRAHHFGFSNYDFGIYSQGLARLALDPPNPWLSGRQIFLFNDHFDPILFLAAPFARVFPAAEVGLVFEAACGVLALFALSWLAMNGRLAPRTQWMLTAMLALHIGVTQAIGFPFHPTTWAMAPMAWLLAALLLERWRTALVFLVLLLACKEEFPFVGVALIPFMWTRASRRVTWTWILLSVCWGLFALVLREQSMPYASQPFRGSLSDRFAPGVLAGAGDWLVAFIPLALFISLSPRGGEGRGEGQNEARRLALLSLSILPMLGIRFLAMAWRDHYGAVLTAAAVVLLAAWLESRRDAPWWLILTTLIITLINDEQLLKRNLKSVTGRQGWGASNGCDDTPERNQSIKSAIELARKAPGPLVVSGNLLPWLAERSDVFAFGGPQGEVAGRTWLLEQPVCGDTWAQGLEQRELQVYRVRQHRVLVDDGHVILGTD